MKSIFTCSLIFLGLFGFWSDQPYCTIERDTDITTETASNPIRFGGLKVKEVNADGSLSRYIIKHKIYIITTQPYKRRKNKPEGKRRISSSFKKRDVSHIRNILHIMFNGLNGNGATSENGELVFFDFDVQEWAVGEEEFLTEDDLIKIANEGSFESGELLFDNYKGKEIYLRVPSHFLISTNLVQSQGFNAGVLTRINAKYKLNPQVYLHEILHQLLDRGASSEHRLGGGLSIPPGILTAKNVSAVLEDALEAKNSIVKVN